MSIRFPLLVLLAITSTSALAAAEPAAPAAGSASATTEARERFQRGVSLYREGSFDAALAEFRRAYEIAPNYRILYNLAQVQVERHDSVAALTLFGQYLQQGDTEIDAERRAQVERDMQSLRGRADSGQFRSATDHARQARLPERFAQPHHRRSAAAQAGTHA